MNEGRRRKQILDTAYEGTWARFRSAKLQQARLETPFTMHVANGTTRCAKMVSSLKRLRLLQGVVISTIRMPLQHLLIYASTLFCKELLLSRHYVRMCRCSI